MRAVTPTIQLFGQFSISSRGRVAKLGIAGVTRELLAYLLTTAGKATRRVAATARRFGPANMCFFLLF